MNGEASRVSDMPAGPEAIAAEARRVVIDPVCGMVLTPGSAVASADYGGATWHFCSEACRRRFLAAPDGYAAAGVSGSGTAHAGCGSTRGGMSAGLDRAALLPAVATGSFASSGLLGIYFVVLALVSGWSFTLEQFADYWPYIVALAVGFGVQVGLFTYLRRAVRAAASGTVIAATGTTSGVAMVSCCTHYLVNLLPALGATGLVSFVGAYQLELFWFGLAANLAGIAYIGRRVLAFAHGG